MITVYIPPSFIPERTYAVKTMLQFFCELDITIIPRSGQLHYDITWNDKSIIIKDQFFGHTIVGETYLSPERIPKKIISTTINGFDKVACLFGEEKIEITANKIVSDVDLFAGAYFMLTRWEESFGLYEDLHGRFPADKALVVKEGYILRPIVDEYVALLKKWFGTLGLSLPQESSTFKVVPTCDVDIPFYWYSRPAWRLLAGRAIRRRKLAGINDDRLKMQAVKSGRQKDPYDTFDYLMSLAEKIDERFLFHMLAGGETKFEGYYDIRDPRIVSLMRQFIARGHGVGLHPSYNSFQDLRVIEKERKVVTEQSGIPVYASRQHYLRFAVPGTWTKLSTAFIKEDSTMGYAAEPGFRCGTSKPFPVFDVLLQKELPLIEKPLLIMDVSLRYYKQFSVEESITYCAEIIRQVKKHQGDLVILWHNSSLSEEDGWTAWSKVLEYLMSAAE